MHLRLPTRFLIKVRRKHTVDVSAVGAMHDKEVRLLVTVLLFAVGAHNVCNAAHLAVGAFWAS
jgi:hypothetical protein